MVQNWLAAYLALLYVGCRVRTLAVLRPDRVTVVCRQPGNAIALIAPLLAGVAALPWIFGAPGAGRMATTGLAAAVLIIGFLLIRDRRTEVRLDGTGTLVVSAVAEERHEPSYRVTLERDGRSPELILEHPDLAVVVRDVSRIVEAAGVTVQTPWSIPSTHFASGGERSPASPSPLRVRAIESESQPRVAAATVGAAAFVLLVFGWSLARAPAALSALGVVLPVLSAAAVILVGAYLASLRIHVELSESGLRVTRKALGLNRLVLSVDRQSLWAAHLITHAGRASGVLFATRQGPRLVTIDAAAAQAIVAAVRRSRDDVSEGLSQVSGSTGGDVEPSSIRDVTRPRRHARSKPARARES